MIMVKNSEIFVMNDWSWRDYMSLMFFPARILYAAVFGWWPRKGEKWMIF